MTSSPNTSVDLPTPGEGVAIEMLAIVGIAVSLFFWVALTRYRKSRTVRLGQPGLCKTFVVSRFSEGGQAGRPRTRGGGT